MAMRQTKGALLLVALASACTQDKPAVEVREPSSHTYVDDAEEKPMKPGKPGAKPGTTPGASDEVSFDIGPEPTTVAKAAVPKGTVMEQGKLVVVIEVKKASGGLYALSTITNTGTGPTDLDPVAALRSGRLRNDYFEILAGGKEAQYQGMMAKRAPPGPEGMLLLKPGESVKGYARLDEWYALPDEGELTIRYRHNNHFADNAQALSSEPVTVAWP